MSRVTLNHTEGSLLLAAVQEAREQKAELARLGIDETRLSEIETAVENDPTSFETDQRLAVHASIVLSAALLREGGDKFVRDHKKDGEALLTRLIGGVQENPTTLPGELSDVSHRTSRIPPAISLVDLLKFMDAERREGGEPQGVRAVIPDGAVTDPNLRATVSRLLAEKREELLSVSRELDRLDRSLKPGGTLDPEGAAEGYGDFVSAAQERLRTLNEKVQSLLRECRTLERCLGLQPYEPLPRVESLLPGQMAQAVVAAATGGPEIVEPFPVVAPPALDDSHPYVDFFQPAVYDTLNAAMKAAANRGEPLGITPGIMTSTVKDTSRKAKKQLELQQLRPRLVAFLTKTLDLIESQPAAYDEAAVKALKVAWTLVISATLMDQSQIDRLLNHFDPEDHGEQYKDLIDEQEGAARRVITESGILTLMPSAGLLGIDWFARAGSFYSEHPLLAPYYRAMQVLAAVRFEKGKNLKPGLDLLYAIVKSGAYEAYKTIEQYVGPLGEPDFTTLTAIKEFVETNEPTLFQKDKVDWDAWVTANMEKLEAVIIHPLRVGRDYKSEIGPDGTDHEGMALFSQLVDPFNEEMQKQRNITADVAIGVLKGYDEARLKGHDEATAGRLFLALAHSVRETGHFSPAGREVVLTGALGGLTDQMEETELYRRPAMLLRGGGPSGPRYTGIYFLPAPKTYGALNDYITAEVAHLKRFQGFDWEHYNRSLDDLEALGLVIGEMHRLSVEATVDSEGKPDEKLLLLPERFGHTLFSLITVGKIGKKKMTITRLGSDTGDIVHFATGKSRLVEWETADGTTAQVALMDFHEAHATSPIAPVQYRRDMQGHTPPSYLTSTYPRASEANPGEKKKPGGRGGTGQGRGSGGGLGSWGEPPAARTLEDRRGRHGRDLSPNRPSGLGPVQREVMTMIAGYGAMPETVTRVARLLTDRQLATLMKVALSKPDGWKAVLSSKRMGGLVEVFSHLGTALKPHDKVALILAAVAGSETEVRRIVTTIGDRRGTVQAAGLGRRTVWAPAGAASAGNAVLRALRI